MSTPSRVAQAVMQLREAEAKRANAQTFERLGDSLGAYCERVDAQQMEAAAEAVLRMQAGDVPVVRAMGEVVAQHIPDPADLRMACNIQDTLEHPDMVTAQASFERMQLLAELGSIEMALDLQKTIDPKNSIERMLGLQALSPENLPWTTIT